MQTNEPLIFDGTPVNPVQLTPYGFYDNDPVFQAEAPKVANFIASRLGFPVVDVELTDEIIYACFEESITTYGAQVNQFQAREYMLSLQGISTSSIITQRNIVGSSLPQLIRLASSYATEADVNGTVDLKKGFINIQPHTQSYDLQALWANVSESNKRIDIRKVYHFIPPAIARYYDPFATTGLGLSNLMSQFGFEGFSPPVTFVMMPAYEDLLRIQAIEINDMIRKSQYSFTIANNKIRFTPRFEREAVIWFDYMVVDDKFEGQIDGSGSSVSDYSNVPYQNIQYNTINSIGRMWIFKYCLALAKETLGMIRSKYQDIPIPDQTIRLDGEILRREAALDKEELIQELRDTLEQTGLNAQLKKSSENAGYMKDILKDVPIAIYIG